MSQKLNIDGVLVTWGDRLFYPGNRIVGSGAQPRLGSAATSRRAAALRRRIEATVVRRARQVMVKVTGGGRSMRAIAAHFRYISKNGRLEIEDQRGETMRGREGLRGLCEEWRFGGSLIPDDADHSHRREAFNIMLSMPRGTDPGSVRRAAREFAQTELANHKYVMVLHDHQANPHVHISVRAESMHGRRLSPRKADLHRWRETFAEKLRGYGVEAEATRRATRGQTRSGESLWRIRAREAGRLRGERPGAKHSSNAGASRSEAAEAWVQLRQGLAVSDEPADRSLARSIAVFMKDMSLTSAATPGRQVLHTQSREIGQPPEPGHRR